MGTGKFPLTRSPPENSALTPALSPRRGCPNGGRGRRRGRGRGRVRVDRNAEAFATEHEPDDAEFPVLEAVEVWVRVGVQVKERARGDEVFATAFAVRKE